MSLFRSFARRLSTKPVFQCSINGKWTKPADLTVSVWDISFQRGDGVFEALQLLAPKPNEKGGNRCWLRASDLHIERLKRSAKALDFTLPEISDKWLEDAAASSPANVPGLLRVLCTRGSQGTSGAHFGISAPALTFIQWEPRPPTPFKRMLPALAPWHPAGVNEEWETIKWLSYAQNLLSTRKAVKAGFDDALLLDRQNNVLDGPRFGVCWLDQKNNLCTPSWQKMGLLQSTSISLTMDAAKSIGMVVKEDRFPLQSVLEAKEVFCCSAGLDAVSASVVGNQKFPVDGEGAKALRDALNKLNASRYIA